MDKTVISLLEAFYDWREALNYEIDTFLTKIMTKEPVKKAKLERKFKVTEEVTNRLLQKLCDLASKKP